MKTTKIASLLVIIIAVITLLTLAQEILIPLILAMVIWFIIKEIRDFIDKVDWIKNNIPKWLRSSFSSLIVFSILGLFISILAANINELKNALPLYESNISHATILINQTFNINLSSVFTDYLVDFDFSQIIKDIISEITSIFGTLFMVLIYILFLFLEESVSSNKLSFIYTSETKHIKAKSLLADIDKSIGNYIALKTLVSIIAGVSSYIIISLLGVDSPFFWAFLISLLNFVPVVGALVGVVFPTIIALLQFGEIEPALLVLFLVGTTQIIVGNIIEPKIVGKSLNVSSLIIILSLAIWGSIWGIFGMVVSVPITVIMIIIFSRFESTKNIAIILSEKGEIH